MSNKSPKTKQVAAAKEKVAKIGAPSLPVRLMTKHEIVALAGVTFPTIWLWMRQGRFPRSRVAGGRTMWLSTEIDGWLANLPRRRLKGDIAEHGTAA